MHVHRHQIDASGYHDVVYGWFDKLVDHFSLHALVECSDEGPIAYVTTWFIDHHRVPRCEIHRAVRLVGRESSAWRQLIVDAWSDHVDQLAPVRFSIVSPQPPSVETESTLTESTLVHVVIEQNSAPATHAAGIISLVRQDLHHASVSHVAVSIGCIATIQHVLQKVKVVDLCALRRCTIRHGKIILTSGDLEELNSGFNIVVFVPPLNAVEMPVPDKLWTPGMAAAMDAHSIPIQDGDDDVAFTQLTVEAQPRVCKPSPHGPTENRGIPVILPGQDVRRRIRPLHDGADDWILPIDELFPLHGVHTAWDNENLLAVKTWYVHHLRRTACIRPRDIQLSDHPIMWIEELRNAWMDLLDPRLPFSIHVVRPSKPPQFRTQQQACHILLEQGHQPTRAAIVITALFEGPAHDGISQGAYSVTRQLDLRQVIDTMEIGFFCSQRSCTLTYAGREMPNNVPFAVQSGDSVRVKVVPAASTLDENDPTEHLHFEDLTLMQHQPLALRNRWRRPDRRTNEGRRNDCREFQFNPAAPEFQPNALEITTQSEFVQTLHSSWAVDAFSWEDEEPSTTVMVWFVNHRSPLTKCYTPRTVQLSQDFTDWEQRIRASWSEMIQPDVEVEYSVVMPAPPMLEHGVTAHVILVQAPRDEWSTSLVSICDSRLGPLPLRIAVTTSEHVTFEQIVQGVNYEDLCIFQQEPVHCDIWYQQLQLLPGHPIPCWTGYSFVMQVDRGRLIPHQEEETLAMLQTHVRTQQTDLTHDIDNNLDQKIQLDFGPAQRAMIWLDTHFSLPTFDVEAQLGTQAHWLPQCLDWLRLDWYDWKGPVECIRVYYDGSFHAQTDSSGSATAAFVLQEGTWKFAGAISVQQQKPPFESYTAELTASLIACNQVFDLVKINAEIFATSPTVEFVYDSLPVGKQSEGKWQAKQDPNTCHAIRSLLRIIGKRWKVSCAHFHVAGHSGDPGNELVDTLASCAAQGTPLHNWDAFFQQITKKNFVQSLEWAWALFTSHVGYAWQSDHLLLPCNSTTEPECATALPFGATKHAEVGHSDVKLQLLTCNVLTLLPGSQQQDTCGAVVRPECKH